MRSKLAELAYQNDYLLNSINVCVYVVNQLGRIVFCNDSTLKVLQFERQDVLGQQAHELWHRSPPDGHLQGAENCSLCETLRDGQRRCAENAVFRDAHGMHFPVQYTSTALVDNGMVLGAVITFENIEKQQRSEFLLRAQNHILQMIAAGRATSAVLHELTTAIEQMNPAVTSSVLRLDEVTATMHHVAGDRLPQTYIQAINGAPIGPNAGSCGTAAYRRETVIVSEIATDPLWAQYRELAAVYGFRACWSSPILSGDNSIVLGTFAMYYEEPRTPSASELEILNTFTHLAGIAIERDIKERKIEQLAYWDELTGLPNRLLFWKTLEERLQSARTCDDCYAILFIDVDRFRAVNDVLGHEVGDLLLQKVTQRILESTSVGASLMRIGGDKFAIILPNICDIKEAQRAAEELVLCLQSVLHIHSHVIQVGLSIGISLYPLHGNTAYELTKHAETAMYWVKDHGGNSAKVYSDVLNLRLLEQRWLEEELQHAFMNGEFTLFFQPQVSLESNTLTGAEALIRWNHPVKGYIPPDQFIPVAEKTGQIIAIGDWVLRETCKAINGWKKAGLPLLRIAVNVSPKQFHQADFVAKLNRILREENMDSKYIEIEITETTLMESNADTLEKMEQLRAQGIRLLLDDFGVGYSSLGYLQRFPVHAIKVDQSFIREIENEGAAIVTAVIALGHSLNLSVVAEGVENKEQLAFLGRCGCDEVQGYLLAKPMPVTEFEHYVRHLLKDEA